MLEYQPVYRYKRSRNVFSIEGEQMFDAVSFSTGHCHYFYYCLELRCLQSHLLTVSEAVNRFG